MKKVLHVVIAGRPADLAADDVARAMRDEIPEPVRAHYAVVEGRRFPPKQVIARVTGIDRADFTTNQARALLRRLGFATGRGSETTPAGRAREAAAPYRSQEADVLRPHIGKWVALAEGEVVVSADTAEEVLSWLRAHERKGDAMFRVPLDPAVDMGGFGE